MNFTADRVLQTLNAAAAQVPSDFKHAFVARIFRLAEQYIVCTKWLTAHPGIALASEGLGRLHAIQQFLLRKELAELCNRFECSSGEVFDLYPEASTDDTLCVLAQIRCITAVVIVQDRRQ